MKLFYIKRLHSGDEITWTDPDNGNISRRLTIKMISLHGDVVRILDTNGNYLECLVDELS